MGEVKMAHDAEKKALSDAASAKLDKEKAELEAATAIRERKEIESTMKMEEKKEEAELRIAHEAIKNAEDAAQKSKEDARTAEEQAAVAKIEAESKMGSRSNESGPPKPPEMDGGNNANSGAKIPEKAAVSLALASADASKSEK